MRVAEAQRALVVRPEITHLRESLIAVLVELEEFELALQMATEDAENERNGMSLDRLASVQAALGRQADARATYAEMLERKPDAGWILRRIAKLTSPDD